MTAKVLEEFKEALEYYKSGRVKTFRGAFSYMNVKHYYDGPIIGGVDLSKLLPETQRPTYRQFYYYCHKNLTKKDLNYATDKWYNIFVIKKRQFKKWNEMERLWE